MPLTMLHHSTAIKLMTFLFSNDFLSFCFRILYKELRDIRIIIRLILYFVGNMYFLNFIYLKSLPY